jgi:hypothetical protein
LANRFSRSQAASPCSIDARARSTAYWFMNAPGTGGASNDSTTRGSRSMFLSLRYFDMCPLTRSSPSSPTQITETCGLPSALIVLRWAIGPDSISARSSSGSALIAAPFVS